MTTLPKSALSLLLVLTLILPGAVRADDASEAAAEQHLRELREVLKSTTDQLRDAQNQIVTAQAAQAAAESANKDLQAKVDSLTGQLTDATTKAAADKSAADQAAAAFNDKINSLTAQLADLNKTLATEKMDNDALSTSLHQLTDADAKLKIEDVLLQRLVDDREAKNLALFELGNEILTRYEKFSLGDALAAKEPFVGLSRVKLETLVQDYKDKLLNQTVLSKQTPPATGSQPAPPSEQLPTEASAKPAEPASGNTMSAATQP